MPAKLADSLRLQISQSIQDNKESFQDIANAFSVCKHTVYMIAKKNGVVRSKMTRVHKRPRELSLEYLRSILEYNRDTGVFVWRNNGKCAGWSDDLGYVHVRIGKGKLYLAHRLAWFYEFGVWPTEVIDHKNGDPADNRIQNLRSCAQQQNCWNHNPNCSRSPIRSGVSFDKRRKMFKAYITVGRRQKYLGRFLTVEEAIAARLAAEEKVFGEFARQ